MKRTHRAPRQSVAPLDGYVNDTVMVITILLAVALAITALFIA